MATSTITLQPNIWTLIGDSAIDFQVQGQVPCYIIESTLAPVDNISIHKTAHCGVHLTFTKVDGSFYMRPVGNVPAIVSVEPVAVVV